MTNKREVKSINSIRIKRIINTVMIISLMLMGVLFELVGCNKRDIDINPPNSPQVMHIKDGQDFKILTVTDSHLNGRRSYRFLLNTLNNLIDNHQPDLVIFIGDNVDYAKDLKHLDKIAKFFEKNKIYWAVALGNHDRDPEKNGVPMGLFAQNQFLQEYNAFNRTNGYCLYVESEWGYEEQLDYNNYPREGNEWSRAKLGNYAVNIKKGDTTVYSLIFLDSGQHRAAFSEENGYIEQYQVNWYKEYIKDISTAHFGLNTLQNNQYIPSMVFLHQPILEYIDAADFALNGSTSGYVPNEYGFGYISSSRGGTQNEAYNYGLFDAMKSVGGTHIFAGHIHQNTSSVLYDGVWFNYLHRVGRRSGEKKNYPDNISSISKLITINGSTNEVDMTFALPNGYTTKDIAEAYEKNK